MASQLNPARRYLRTRRSGAPIGHLVLAALVTAMAPAPASATPFAYVGSNVGGNSVKVIDTATNTVVATVPMDATPGGIAVSPDGSRVYVTPYSIKVIDTATNTVTATIPNLGTTFSPTVSPDGTRLYVSNYVCGGCSNIVQVIDTATNTQVTTVSVGVGTIDTVINPAGTRLYVLGGPSGYISVVDTTTNSVVATITGLDWQLHAAITPDGTKLYTGGRQSAPIAVINTATNSLATTIPINYGFNGLAMKPDGTRLYATTSGTGTMHVVDVATDTLLTDAPAGCSPGGAIAINPAGTRAYFHAGDGCDGGVERIFDTASNTVVGSVVVNPGGGGPSGSGLYIGPFCPGACSDGNPCTTDSCNPISGTCSYTNNTGPCASDGNPCTNDVCDGAGNCTHPNSPLGSSCNDGTFCNGADTCDGAGGCTNHPGDPCAGGPECARTCNESAGNCFDPATTTCASDGNVCTDDHCDGAGACVHPANTASCDDGLFCNGTDMCAGGMCMHSGNPCTGGPECADTCNESADNCFDLAGTPCTADTNPCTLDQCNGTGACTHPAGNAGAVCRPSANQCDATETCTGTSATCPPDGPVPDGTTCTDGDPCTTGEVCTAGVCGGGTPTPAGCIDHYLCYKVKQTSGFLSNLPVNLTDQFETAFANVGKAKDICPPANKNGEGIHDPVTHEEAYQIKQETAHVPRTNLTVTDQFGTLHVNTVKPDRLLVPTNKGLGTPPPGPPAPGVADHYKCYKIKITPGTTGFAKGLQATVVDQFQTRLYEILKPKLLCTPVDKNGEGIQHPLAHLMCYQVKTAKGQQNTVPVVGQIYTQNQFGQGRLDTVREDVLCVPATKTP